MVWNENNFMSKILIKFFLSQISLRDNDGITSPNNSLSDHLHLRVYCETRYNNEKSVSLLITTYDIKLLKNILLDSIVIIYI